MASAAGEFLGAPLAHWDDAARPLLGQALREFQPLATRLDPARVAQLVLPDAAPAAAPAAAAAATATAAATAPAAKSKEKSVTTTITIDDFAKLDLRVARVAAASLVEGSEKLLKLELDLGTGQRTVFSGIRASYAPEQLVGRMVVVVANLAPRKMRFGTSEGMVLCASGEADPVFLLGADAGVQPGMKVS
jgi:methionyl-tRNA synthetase